MSKWRKFSRLIVSWKLLSLCQTFFYYVANARRWIFFASCTFFLKWPRLQLSQNESKDKIYFVYNSRETIIWDTGSWSSCWLYKVFSNSVDELIYSCLILPDFSNWGCKVTIFSLPVILHGGNNKKGFGYIYIRGLLNRNSFIENDM